MKKWPFALLLAAVVLLAAVNAWASQSAVPPPSPAPTPTQLPEIVTLPGLASFVQPQLPQPGPAPTPAGAQNPLTGESMDEALVKRRPVAVMLNNLKQAQPQLGQSKADIIYEVLAEGGITRMLGVYQSVDGVGTIGSVRSSRTYYLELALGLDAVYLHAGGSPDAYEKIKSWGVTALDCVNGPYEGRSPGANLFWRDAARRKNNGYEHSVVTTGETIISRFAGYSFRQEHEEGYALPLSFVDDATPAAGESAKQVTVPFSNYKTGTFTYDEGERKYLVSQYGGAYVDGNDGSQVAATNLLVLKTDCHIIPGDSYGRIDVDLTSGGEGWFACGGRYIPIRWAKADQYSPFVYTTTDGQPLSLSRGNSYVCIVPLQAQVSFE